MAKILLSGAPCSGKTTLFESIPPHKSIIFIPEVARCILSEKPELKPQPNFQDYLLSEQLRLEQLAEQSQSSLIICDRGYVDVIAYSRFFGHPIDNELIFKFLPYDMIFQTSTEGVMPVGEYSTESGLQERQKLDEIFHSLFGEIGIPTIELKGPPETRLHSFLSSISNRFNIEGVNPIIERRGFIRGRELEG